MKSFDTEERTGDAQMKQGFYFVFVIKLLTEFYQGKESPNKYPTRFTSYCSY